MTCGCEEVSGGIKMSKRLNQFRDAVVHEVGVVLKEVEQTEETLAAWTLLQKTLLKLAGDVDDVVQAIKVQDRREAANVDHTT